MKILNFELDKTFFKHYIIAGAVTSLGALLIYSKQHNKFTFNLGEYLLHLPAVWSMIFLFAISTGIFLNWGDRE
jgi:hypothetical protein